MRSSYDCTSEAMRVLQRQCMDSFDTIGERILLNMFHHPLPRGSAAQVAVLEVSDSPIVTFGSRNADNRPSQ